MRQATSEYFCGLVAVLICGAVHGAPAGKPAEVEKYDLTPLLGSVFAKGGSSLDRKLHGPDEAFGKSDAADLSETIQVTIREFIAPDSWENAGGKEGSIKLDGNTLLIRAAPAVHQQIKVFLKQLIKPQAVHGKRDPKPAKPAEKEDRKDEEPVIVVYDIHDLPARASGLVIQANKTTLDEACEALCARVVAEVANDSWKDAGGSIGTLRVVSGLAHRLADADEPGRGPDEVAGVGGPLNGRKFACGIDALSL